MPNSIWLICVHLMDSQPPVQLHSHHVHSDDHHRLPPPPLPPCPLSPFLLPSLPLPRHFGPSVKRASHLALSQCQHYLRRPFSLAHIEEKLRVIAEGCRKEGISPRAIRRGTRFRPIGRPLAEKGLNLIRKDQINAKISFWK